MFKRGIFVLAALLAAIVFATPSDAWFRHGSGSGTCPQAIDNGCAAANQNGVYRPANLINTVTQSGQNSLLGTHPMGFNVPAVDYPVGYDKTITLKDPRTINDSVCQWNATYLECSVTGSGVVNEVLDGYDFSGSTIGQTAVGIWAPNNHVSPGSTFTITNSKFSLVPSLTDIVSIGGNFSNLVFKNNQCDGASANSASGFCIGSDSTGTGTFDIEYNAFTNQGVGRVSGGETNINFVFKYNFVQGLNDLGTSNHGEIMIRNCTGARANCTAYDYYEGNFIVWNPPPASGLNNATAFPGDGSSDGVILSSFGMINNVIVTNINGSTTVIDQALFNARLSSLGTVTMTGNYVDASGANSCSINGVKSGGNTVTASSSGNTLTVTGLSSSFGNNPIEPGWFIIHSGFTTTPITAYGTGGGNTGTYTFGGAAQNIASDSNWTLVPGYSGTPTLTPNWLLNDPSHTGSVTPMGLSGPQFVATNCF